MNEWHLELRLDSDARRSALHRIAGAVGGLVVAGLLLLISGRNPFSLLWKALDAVLGSKQGIEGVGIRAIPILMCALAVALSLRMKVWNIGSDGQFLIGAFAAVGVGIHLDAPAIVVLPLMALAAIAAGAVWILVPALARAYWNVNEIITTLLLNFVAVQLVAWSSLTFWRDQKAKVIQSTEAVKHTLPKLPGFNSVSIALIVPLLIAVILWWLFNATTTGFEIDTIGGNRNAAAYAGINVPRRIVVVMLTTGAIAGLAGMLQLSAPGAQQLNAGFSAQYGLSGFIVAALAGGSFVGLVVGGLFIAAMFFAGVNLQTEGLSTYIIFATYGSLLIGIAVGEVSSRYRLVRTRRVVEGASA